MKILNIVDLNLLKIFLNKYYITVGLEYLFVVPHKETLKRHIKQFKPDVVLIQDSYFNMTAEEIIDLVRKSTITPILVFSMRDSDNNTGQTYKQKDVTTVAKQSFFNKIEELTAQVNERDESFSKHEPKRSVLFVDDALVMREFAKKAFEDQPFEVFFAGDGEEGWNLYNEKMPNLVVTDIEMPKMDGLTLCRLIKENNNGRFIPVIIVSSRSKPVDIDTAFNCGADDYLTKPVTADELNHIVEEYFSVLDRKKRNKVLLVDDSKVSAEVISHALMKNSLNVLVAYNGREGFALALKEHPEVIITDIEMPEMNGYELAQRIKEHPELKETALVMMSTHDKKSDIKKGEKLGISRYFTKPFDVEKMVLVVEQLLLEKYNIYKKEYEYMLSTIRALITALEARDQYTKGHTHRVSEYSLKLGKFMGLSAYNLNELEIAANLHDVGKIGVRDDILLKPGRLSDDEYAKIQEHAVIGAEILKPLKLLETIIPLILFHHERWDGKGYPSMIKGEKIPLGARIIAIADTYDAITSDRPYRRALARDEALRIIEESIGEQFCPVTGRAFLEMMRKEKK